MGPQIKGCKTSAFQMPMSTLILMSKMVPSLVPSQRAEPLMLNETEALWATQEYAALLLCASKAASLRRLLSSALCETPSGLCSENHCGPMKLDMPTEC